MSSLKSKVLNRKEKRKEIQKSKKIQKRTFAALAIIPVLIASQVRKNYS